MDENPVPLTSSKRVMDEIQVATNISETPMDENPVPPNFFEKSNVGNRIQCH